MAGDYQTANDRTSDGVTLDRMPDGPPEKRKTGGDRGGGLGEFASSPGLMTLQGLEQIEKGMQLIAAGAPSTAPVIQQMAILLTQLRQAVPQALSGGRSQFAPSGMLTPPGMMPGMGAPPGIGAQGGAPGAPTPLPQGLG